MLNLQYGFFQSILSLVFLLVVLVKKRRKNLHLNQVIKLIKQTKKKGLD